MAVNEPNVNPGEESKASEGSADDVHQAEVAALNRLGYQQELKRDFPLLEIVAFSFSIVTSWTALAGVMIIGVQSGGPPVIIWSWIAICLLSLAVAYSLAEMCSAYPVAGGQYAWVAIFAPRKWRRSMSYICGWLVQTSRTNLMRWSETLIRYCCVYRFLTIGILAMGATSHFVTANFIVG